MKIGFVCWRPYQVFNVINYIEEFLYKQNISIEQIDLYLSDTVMRHKINTEFLKKEYFDNIIQFNTEEKDRKIHRIIKFVADNIFLKRGIRKDMVTPSFQIPKYDCLAASGYCSFFVRLRNINKKAGSVLLEDGSGAYICDEIEKTSKLWFNRVLRLFNRGPLSVKFNVGYYYRPDLAQYSPGYKVETLPVPSEKTICNCKKAFDYSYDESYGKFKMIYFTNPDYFVKQYGMTEEEIVEKICDKDSSLLIRFHPARKNWDLKDYSIDSKNEMWELQCGGITPSNVMISIFSTTMITPFMIYGKNCRLVFLYRLIFKKDDPSLEYADKFLLEFKKIYPNDIYIPDTFEQARDILRRLNKS